MALTDTAIKAAKLPAVKKQLITQGIDPSLKKQADKQARIAEPARQQAVQDAESNTFEVVAREWHDLHKVKWSGTVYAPCSVPR